MSETRTTGTGPSQLPDLNWLKSTLLRRLELAGVDQREGATQRLVVRGSSFAMFAGMSWTFQHEPMLSNGEVTGYNARIIQDLRGGYTTTHMEVAENALHELGYVNVRRNGDTVSGALLLETPFTPVS
jgi:hypothetical protein